MMLQETATCLLLLSCMVELTICNFFPAPCPKGTFGADCQGVCRCLNGADVCRSEDGRCTDRLCSHGWTNPPLCQSECPAGKFGLECAWSCRCPPMDVCNPVNGLCSLGRCLQGWTGRSCQIQLPILNNPPTVINTTLTSVAVSWPRWKKDVTGLGDGPIVAYILEVKSSLPGSDWLREAIVEESDKSDWFVHTVKSLRPGISYKLRIQLEKRDGDKTLLSDPGKETAWIKINCRSPTGFVTDIQATLDTVKKAVFVTWKPPDISTVKCNRISSFDIILSCAGDCIGSRLSVPNIDGVWSAYVSYGDTLSNSTVISIRAVNDGGLAGPFSHAVPIMSSDPLTTQWPTPSGTTEGLIPPGVISQSTATCGGTACSTARTSSTARVGDGEDRDSSGDKSTEENRKHITQGPTTTSRRTYMRLSVISRDQTSVVVQPSQSVDPLFVLHTRDVQVIVEDTLTGSRSSSIFYLTRGRIAARELKPATKYQIIVLVKGRAVYNLNPGTALSAVVWTVPTVKHIAEPERVDNSTEPSVLRVLDVTDSTILIDLKLARKHEKSDEAQRKGDYDTRSAYRISLSDTFSESEDNAHRNARLKNVPRQKAIYPEPVKNTPEHVIQNIFTQDEMIQGYLIVVDDESGNLDSHRHLKQAYNPDSYALEGSTDSLLPYREARELNRSYYVAGWVSLHQTKFIVGDGQFSVPGIEQTLPYWLYSEAGSTDSESYDNALPGWQDIIDRFWQPFVHEYRLRYGSNTSLDDDENVRRRRSFRYVDNRQVVVKRAVSDRGVEELPSHVPMYHNVPLTQNTLYNIWIVREDRVQGVAVRSFPLDGGVPVITKPLLEDSSNYDGSAISTKVAIIIVVVGILLVLALLVVIFLYMYHKRKFDRALDKMRDSDIPSLVVRRNTASPFARGSSSPRRNLISNSGGSTFHREHGTIDDMNEKYYLPPAHMAYGEFSDNLCNHQIATNDIRKYMEYQRMLSGLGKPSGSSSSSPERRHSVKGSPRSHSPDEKITSRIGWFASSVEEEFMKLPTCFTDSVNVANEPWNAPLNRSSRVVPYDRNRVSLSRTPVYVNASRVRTLGSSSCIVAQCPFDEATALQFWRLIWQQSISDVVMLMNLNNPSRDAGNPTCGSYLKCGRYWPLSVGDVAMFGRYEVRLTFQMRFSFYVYRELTVTNTDNEGSDGNERVVHSVRHWQFTAWREDDEVPLSPLLFLLFIRRIRDVRACLNADLGGQSVRELKQRCEICYDVEAICGGEILVHCQVGGGVSGLYLAVDMLLTMGHNVEYVDVLGCVASLRYERVDMVSTVRQYRFIYACVTEEFSCRTTRLTSDKFSLMFDGLERCESVIASLGREHELAVAMPSKRKGWKDSGISGIYIENEEEYIAIADRFVTRNGFLAMTCHLASFRNIFWSVVADNDVSCIVVLNKISDGQKNRRSAVDIERVLPQCGKVVNCAEYTISCSSVRVASCYIVYGFCMSVRRPSFSNDSTPVILRNIVLYEFTAWPSNQEVPETGPLLELLAELRRVIGQNEQLLAFSSSELDRGRAGLLCALWWAVEQSEYENVVDLFSTARVVRDSIPNAVDTPMKYQFLHTAVREHIRSNSAHGALSRNASMVDRRRASLRFASGTPAMQQGFGRFSRPLLPCIHLSSEQDQDYMRTTSRQQKFEQPIDYSNHPQRAVSYPIVQQQSPSPDVTPERIKNPAYQPVVAPNVLPCSRNQLCNSLDFNGSLRMHSNPACGLENLEERSESGSPRYSLNEQRLSPMREQLQKRKAAGHNFSATSELSNKLEERNMRPIHGPFMSVEKVDVQKTRGLLSEVRAMEETNRKSGGGPYHISSVDINSKSVEETEYPPFHSPTARFTGAVRPGSRRERAESPSEKQGDNNSPRDEGFVDRGKARMTVSRMEDDSLINNTKRMAEDYTTGGRALSQQADQAHNEDESLEGDENNVERDSIEESENEMIYHLSEGKVYSQKYDAQV